MNRSATIRIRVHSGRLARAARAAPDDFQPRAGGSIPTPIVPVRFENLRIAFATLASLHLASCGIGEEPNLWNRDFTKSHDSKPAIAHPANDVKGYWEGKVAMGGVRTRIEDGRITVALKCDREGKILSQGSTAIAFRPEAPAAMMLLENLTSGKEELCGFRFFKGSEFRYRLRDNGTLELDFAGTSMAELRRLAD